MKKLLLIPLTALLVMMMFATSFATSGTAHAASVQAMQPQAHAVALAPMHTLAPAVSCSGNACTGLDPIQTGCSASASTILSAGIFDNGTQVGTVNLRFSSVCQTNWAQVLSNDNHDIAATVTRASGVDGPSVQEFISFTGTDAFTNMVWAPDVPTRADGGINLTNHGVASCVTQDQNALPC